MAKRARGNAAKTGPLVEWLRGREDEMAAFLAQLVPIPRENPPGKNYRAWVNLLESQMRELGLECERIATAPPRTETDEPAECLMASFGRGDQVLYFHGHYDVVPAQSPEQFQPSRKDHFLFGRGSCDMKGGIVAMFYAILALKESGAELNGKMALTLVPNEETGCHAGSAWLATQGRCGRGAIGILLAEPTIH